MINQFFIKAEPGEALVKTGFGMEGPQAYLSSAFVLPLLHQVDKLDLTVKTVRIERRGKQSLSCADGIRAEVEVDFYVKINSEKEAIEKVARSIGCGRASDKRVLRELFEAKFADALKTAGAKLEFDQLYHNRQAFRDEIIKAMGGTGEGPDDLEKDGYHLGDVAIQYLEQLELEMHDEDNVLDARGRKEIAERTSEEAESANERLRQKEVTIAEQDREARLRQLSIEENIAEEEAAQEREIKETEAREQAQTEQTIAEQEQKSEEARIRKEQNIQVSEEERERSVEEAEIKRQESVALAEEQKQKEVALAEEERQKEVALAEEERQQEIETAEVERERSVNVAEEEKRQDVEITRIEREAAEAEAEKQKLVKLEATAEQEKEYLRAEEEKKTVGAVEEAKRKKKLAALNAAASQEEAKGIEALGKAEASVRKAEVEAENAIGHRLILARTLQEVAPQLPQLVEHLMKPTEEIDDLRILNVDGLDGASQLSQNGTGGDGAPAQSSSITGSVLNTVLDVGALLPVLRELMNGLNNHSEYNELVDALKQMPGGESLMQSLDDTQSESVQSESVEAEEVPVPSPDDPSSSPEAQSPDTTSGASGHPPSAPADSPENLGD